jgi:hypothetical protein
MIVKYFSSLDELVSNVCRDIRGWRRLYGAVHVGRVFGLKRYADGRGELTRWDWVAVPYCSNVRERLLLSSVKPILAFVRAGHFDSNKTVFYVYFNRLFFSDSEVEEIVNEFNEHIKLNCYALEMRSE